MDRMDHDRVVETVYTQELNGRRPRCRPRRDDTQADLQTLARQSATNRDGLR